MKKATQPHRRLWISARTHHSWGKRQSNAKALDKDSLTEITGMYMIDEEGDITCRDVNAKFVNGEPVGIEAKYVMKSKAEWDRFMRFMQRYAEANGLGLNKS